MHIQQKWINRWHEAATLIFLVTIAIVIMMMSPLNPLYKGLTATDSGVFKYVALVMYKGGMPYRDTFEHKGPLLYILNYIGMLISYYRGLWIVESLFMISLLFLLYKTARLFCNRFLSIMVVLLCCSCFSEYFGGGNYAEEYSMVFIAGGIYIFLDYFINKRISKLRLALCGFCFAAVILLRMDAAAIWGVFSIGVLIRCIIENDKKWVSFLMWFLIGIGVIVIPIFIWLIVNDAFSSFLSDYIFFNLTYASYASGGSDIPILSRYNSITYFLSKEILLGAIIILLYWLRKKENLFVNTVYLFGMVFTLIVISISGRGYWHYGMIIIPLFVYPYAKFYGSNIGSNNSYKLVLSIFLVTIVFSSWQNIGKIAVTKYYSYTQGEVTALSEEDENIVNIIEKNTGINDRIMVLGNQDIWYVLSGRLAASKYSYQIPIVNLDDELLKDFLKDMRTNRPKLVIVAGDFEWLFPNIQEYKSIYSYSSGNKTIKIYKLKNA